MNNLSKENTSKNEFSEELNLLSQQRKCEIKGEIKWEWAVRVLKPLYPNPRIKFHVYPHSTCNYDTLNACRVVDSTVDSASINYVIWCFKIKAPFTPLVKKSTLNFNWLNTLQSIWLKSPIFEFIGERIKFWHLWQAIYWESMKIQNIAMLSNKQFQGLMLF